MCVRLFAFATPAEPGHSCCAVFLPGIRDNRVDMTSAGIWLDHQQPVQTEPIAQDQVAMGSVVDVRDDLATFKKLRGLDLSKVARGRNKDYGRWCFGNQPDCRLATGRNVRAERERRGPNFEPSPDRPMRADPNGQGWQWPHIAFGIPDCVAGIPGRNMQSRVCCWTCCSRWL